MKNSSDKTSSAATWVAEYGEHAIREVTLTPDDLRHEVEPHDFWQPAEKPGILDVLRQRRR